MLKPGIEWSNSGSYRPIAFTSHICKIMEKIIDEQLTYFVEKRGYLSKILSGFEKSINIMDPVYI